MRLLKSAVRAVIDTAILFAGGLRYQLGGSTWPSSYLAMVRLFCFTGGVSNDLMSRLVRAFDRRQSLPEPKGELGVRGHADVRRIADNIRSDGFHVFKQRLPDDVCDRLIDFALRHPASVRPMTASKPGPKRLAVYDREHPLAVRYDFAPNDVLALPDVQSLLTNPAILSVAQDYLGGTPIADVISMWWHTGFSHQPDEEAAQFFHFDMDRIKWLKFFINLTEVVPESGPHCFVKGSHRTGGIPRELLSRGYVRLSDEDVLKHYAPDRIVQFVGERGTVLAEDTRGLHKGLAVLAGHRLMLQLQFSNSLFGGFYPSAGFRLMAPALENMVRKYPRVYQNYSAAGGGKA
jgi:hypothetical protein